MIRTFVALAAAFTVTSVATMASAAPPGADAGVVSCVAVEQRLAETRRTLERCEDRRQNAENEKQSCSEELSSTSGKLDDLKDAEKTCRTSKDALCTEAAAFARQLIDGRVANVGSCVPSKEQMQLTALLRGWENSTNALGQLAAFSSGESDTIPHVTGSTPPERAVERLLGKGPREPLFYRRLLTESLRLAAPQAWQRIRAGGAAGIESWFSSATAPLDPKLVEEVDRAHSTPNGQGGPPVSAALRLVQSYIYVARCTEEVHTHSCTRARQLQQLFESTGPLLVRRRIEDIWATECHDAGPDRILIWFQDFPTPHITARTTDYSDVAAAAQSKLFTCYLDDAGAEPSFRTWLESKLPSPKRLTARTLSRIDDLRSRTHDGSPADTCGRAVRAMQGYAMPNACSAPSPEIRASIERWSKIAAESAANDDFSLQTCAMYARLLWEGRAATIPGAFERPPSVDEAVIVDVRVPETPFARLRRACQDRHGEGDSVGESIPQLSKIARGFGESPAGVPWRVDPASDTPIEKVRFTQSKTFGAWVKHLFSRQTSCQALGISELRCQQCLELPRDAFYDCRLELELDELWTHRARTTFAEAAGLLLAIALLVWGVRLARARRVYETWGPSTCDRLGALGLPAHPDPMRVVFPSYHDALIVELPREPAWEPWGTRACVARVDDPSKVQEGDVNHAVAISRRVGTRIVFLVHADTASLDLGAVRAILDWAAKGGARAMQVLPVAISRLAWAHAATDLLELVEETSLRGNPFDMRGRITSSSQFWNRERLVSGLLAETRAGRWVIVTGLRRFGKSSLALEVARRLTGPSAYVDLAGFHHEFAFIGDPARAVDAVLRSLCARLVDSARALYPAAQIPDPPSGEIDAAALTRWIRDLSAECSIYAEGRPPPILLILDEIEQILNVGPERLGHVLDALAILLGRLRNAVGDAPRPGGSSSVGIVMCSALHPLLWAPLRTLGQQSIIGAFPAVCVPHLTPEAAGQMMRGLGARQGIRFSEEALSFIVEQSQGVPLLLRRIGTSVLELYDADHARQGGLGAVQIGIEGAREAVQREEREGAPLRVWVESEIAESQGPAGAMLRRLANEGRIETGALRAIAERHVLAQFTSTGMTSHLPNEELQRRAQEAASVMLRLLGETGLVEPIGDLTSPEAYQLPEGSIRRVLRSAATAKPVASESPSAHPEP